MFRLSKVATPLNLFKKLSIYLSWTQCVSAKRVNLEIPESDDPQLIERQRVRKRLLAIMLDAARFYYTKLLDEEGLKARFYRSKDQFINLLLRDLA